MNAPLHLRLLLVIFISAFGFVARAEVKLPALFSDHVVLQCDVTVPVWGWAEPNENVSVTLGPQTQSARAAADGKWTVKFSALHSRQDPTTLTVKASNTI